MYPCDVVLVEDLAVILRFWSHVQHLQRNLLKFSMLDVELSESRVEL